MRKGKAMSKVDLDPTEKMAVALKTASTEFRHTKSTALGKILDESSEWIKITGSHWRYKFLRSLSKWAVIALAFHTVLHFTDGYEILGKLEDRVKSIFFAICATSPETRMCAPLFKPSIPARVEVGSGEIFKQKD